MDYQIYLALAPFIWITTAFLLVSIARKWHYTGARDLFWFVAAVSGYLVFNYIELVAPSLQAKLLSAKIEGVFYSLLPATWLLFVADFTGRREWKRFKRFWPFFLPALLTVLVVFTNELHRQFWTEAGMEPVAGLLALKVSHGGLFFAMTALVHAMLLAGAILVVKELAGSRSTYRRQLFVVILGLLIALAFNLVYVFQLIPGLRKDYTPIGCALGALVYIVGIYRFRFLELAPASRSRIFEALRDGIVVLDANERIVDMNALAMSVLGLGDADLGGSIQVCRPLAPLLARDREVKGAPLGLIRVEIQGEQRSYEPQFCRLDGGGRERQAALIVLYDVTERVRLFEEVKTLRGILPICMRCKKIRNDKGFWQSVEAYVSERSYAEFSHGLCPDCFEKFYPDPRTDGDRSSSN